MTYEKQSWENFPSTETPISANRLDHIEEGLRLASIQAERTDLASGFPARRAGEKIRAYFFELGTVYTTASGPVGSKPQVLAEEWDKPGVLREIWVATDSGGQLQNVSNYQESGSVIRIFIDDDTTPVLEMSMGDFFMYYPMCGKFSNKRIGRTHVDPSEAGLFSGAYRHLWMPFQKYLRVEVENISPATSCISYGAAIYSTVDEFSTFGNQQLSAQVAIGGGEEWPLQTPMTIVDIDGSGQIEAAHYRVKAEGVANGGLVEGNMLIFIDNEVRPSFRSSGGEDWPSGSWGDIPIGGYPGGAAGGSGYPGLDEEEGGAGISFYNFFEQTPIFFSTHLKVVMWPGQPHQGEVTATEGDVRGTIYYWLDEPAEDISYTVVDTDATPLYSPGTPINGSNPAWTTAVAGTWTVSGGKFLQAATSNDLVLTMNNTSINGDTGIWVESTVAITDPSTANQETFLWATSSGGSGYVGSRAAMEFKREADADGLWRIVARDDFDNCGSITIGDGTDLTNVQIDLAMKIVGTRVTGYWRYHGDTKWQPLVSWTSAKGPFTKIGVGTWGAKATFTPPIVRPLKTVTS